MKSVRRLVILSICASVLFVVKIILMPIPNIELVTFLLIIYTLIFTLKEALAISTIFTLVEIQLLTLSEQAYIWTLIVLVTYLFKRIIKDKFNIWAIYSGLFGLIFGTLSAIPFFVFYEYFSYNLPEGTRDITISLYILKGLPFDAIHMVGNYFLMLLLGEIVYKKLQRLLKEYYY